MHLPNLNDSDKQIKQIVDFRGYNHNPSIIDGEFYDMFNLSSSQYPVLSPRKPRGTVQVLTSPNGIIAKNALAWVDGTNFYYNGVIKGTVSNNQKQLLSMGAYILIFPDKVYYNTSTDVFGNLETTFSTSESVPIYRCTLDGTISSTGLYLRIIISGLGNVFKQYDGVTISGCSVAELNTTKIIRNIGTDYIVVDAGSVTNYINTGIVMKRTVPDMDFLVENTNRVWGCSSSKHEIYASKLGDPFNWNCFEGISTDSYAATIGSDGDFTGGISYLGYVLFFKEDRIHKIYGSKPSNFQIFDNACKGVAKGSEKSLSIVNNILFYLSRDGIMAYQGSLPENISHEFGDVKYSNAVSGALVDKYYISMKDSSNTWHLFVYDNRLNMWHKEDNTHATYFTMLNGELYYIDASTNTLKKMIGTDTDLIRWYGEFSDYSEQSMNKKYIHRIQLRAELEASSTMEAWIMYDNTGIWERIITISGRMKKLYNIPIKVRRCSFYKLKLSGIGQCKIYSFAKIYREGSDK